MEKYYRFAGIELAVCVDEDRMYDDDLQLTNFRTDHATSPHRYRVTVADRLPAHQGPELAVLPGVRIYGSEGGYVRYTGPENRGLEDAYSCAEHRGKEHHVTLRKDQVPGMVSARLVLNNLDVEHLVADAGGVILHASCISWRGKMIVFTAPSGTGKSTQAELWKIHRGADILNGDRAVLMTQDMRVCASGLPFSGSSPYCENRTEPLAAVVYLRQAPVTSIRQLRGREAFLRVWEGCCVNNWNRQDVDNAIGLVEKLLQQVPVFELACTPDESAVTALEAQMRKQVDQ